MSLGLLKPIPLVTERVADRVTATKNVFEYLPFQWLGLQRGCTVQELRVAVAHRIKQIAPSPCSSTRGFS